MVISGKVTFDRVPTGGANGGLDYAATRQDPVRFGVVNAVDAAGNVVASGLTDAAGSYSLEVPAGTELRIRADARSLDPDGEAADWDVAVVDNTNENAQYAVQGALADSGSADSTRDLNADSGWGGSSYSGPRASAPFAVLDSATEAVLATVAVDADVVLPAVQFRWSPENVPVPGDPAVGQITTSSYQSVRDADGNIIDAALFILGAADNDTDEFDETVVIHEWGHYFEDQVSRSDSIGGQHSLNDRLDSRIALGEGFGNALAGIVTGKRFYRDTSGNAQSRGFSLDLERNPVGQDAGWYSERTIQGLLYDLFDAPTGDDDTLSAGYGPLYAALRDPAYTGTDAFLSIFPLLDAIERNTPSVAAELRALAVARGINGTGDLGAGETNDGGIAVRLPVYRELTVGGPAVEFCSVDDAGFYNKLGNRAYFVFTRDAEGANTIEMTRTSGPTNRDPDFNVFQGGTLVQQGASGDPDREVDTRTLPAGTYVIDAFDFWNVAINPPSNAEPRADVCFDVSVR